MAVIQDEQGNNKPIVTDTSHVFDVNGNPLHGELFIGETIASDDVEEIDGYAHESEIAEINSNLTECVKKNSTADITVATASGRSIAQALNLLINSSKWDISKVNAFSYIKIGVAYYRVSSVTASRVVFTYDAVSSANYTSVSLYAQAGANYAYTYNGSTVTSTGGETLSNDLEFYY